MNKFLCLLMLINANVYIFSQVSAEEVSLKPIKTDNRTVIYSLSGYNAKETDAAKWFRETPMMKNYDYRDPRWWDNMVSEQIQGRMSVIQMSSRGHWTTNPADEDGPSEYNPRKLWRLIDAFERRGITPDIMKVTCFIDAPMLKRIYNTVYRGQPITNNNTDPYDFANTEAYDTIWWQRAIMPWFDTIPQEYWFYIDGRPLITIWNTHPNDFINITGNGATTGQGNVYKMLTKVSELFQAKYGVKPWYIPIRKTYTSANQDPTIINHPDVFGFSGWFNAYDNDEYAWSVANEINLIGTGCPGFTEDTFYDNSPSNPHYQSYDRVIFRNGLNGTGWVGQTMWEGLENVAVLSNARVFQIEGWTDQKEAAGILRSEHANFTTPNQYINMIAKYSDLKKETIKFELEGADSYWDSTVGNTVGKFRRQGDLDIKEIDNMGWAVCYSTVGEWMEFKDYYLPAGTYEFYVRYASVNIPTFSISIDNQSLGVVSAPSTLNSTNFQVVSLGTATITAGDKDIKFTFENGQGDADWIFVKRLDKEYTLKSKSSGRLVEARKGGNDTVYADIEYDQKYVDFMIADLNGGVLNHGDSVSIQTYNGMFLSAKNGGNNDILANKYWKGGWETFTIEKITGTGAISMGDEIAFKSQNGYYIQVLADKKLDIRASTKNTASTFIIQLQGSNPAPVGEVFEAEDVGFFNSTIKQDIPVASGGEYLDINEGGYLFFNYTAGQLATVDIDIHAFIPGGGARSMGLHVNGVRVQGVSFTSIGVPEVKTITGVQVGMGVNEISLRDSEGTYELNVDKIVIKNYTIIPAVVYQAETITLTGAYTIASGATGQYVDMENGSGMSFNHSVVANGKIRIDVGVFVPSGQRIVGLWVNNVKVGVINCNSTILEEKIFLDVPVKAGNNTIEIRDSEGGNEPNVDYFLIKNYTPDSVVRLEAENGVITGSSTIKVGGTGQYVDMENSSTITMTHYSAYTQNVTIDIGVFVPSGQRIVGLWVNNVKVGIINCNSTTLVVQTFINIPLNFGANTIEVRDSEGGNEPNIDYIEIKY